MSADNATVNLTDGIRTEDGSCVFGFILNVPDVESYRFELAGFGVTNVQRSMIETIGDTGEIQLEVQLSW